MVALKKQYTVVTTYKNSKKNIPKKFRKQAKKVTQKKTKITWKEETKINGTKSTKLGILISLIPSILESIEEYNETRDFNKSFSKFLSSSVSGIADPLGFFEELTGKNIVEIMSGNSETEEDELIKELNNMYRYEI